MRLAPPALSGEPGGELEALEADQHHPQQQRTVLEHLDLGIAEGACAIAHRHLHDAQTESRSAEQQVEVAEWIEVPKVAAVGGDPVVVPLAHYLGTAERVLDR